MSETVAPLEIKNSTPDDGDVHNTATSRQSTGPAPQLQSSPEKSDKKSSQTPRRGCSSKVKPKPNLSQASRTRQQKSQPETSTGMTTVERPVTSSEATSDHSTSEHQSHCSSDTRLESSVEQPTRESTDEAQLCDNGRSKINSDNLGTSDTAVTEIQRPSIQSLPVQQSSEHSTPSVTPVNDLPVSQKEGSEDAATQQTRRSRIQKVKPKPNTTRASRTAVKPTKAGEVESTRISSPERQVESCPASDFVPSIGEGSALTSTEELSPTQEKSINSGVDGQVESGAVTSDHKASQNRLIPETTRDTSPTPESTEGKTVCCDETSTEPGPKTDSAPETIEQSAPPTVHDTQKEESKSASAHPTGRSRFPKVKPKPNIALTSRTARSKAVKTNDTAEKDSNATPKPKIPEKTPADAEEEPSIISPEKQSQGTGSASDFMSCDVRSAFTPTEEPSTSGEKKTSVGIVGQLESSTATSDQKSTESQDFSEVQFEPSKEQVTRDTSPASEMSLQTSDSTDPPQVGPESNRYSAPIQESSDHPASCIPHAEESPVSQKAESEMPSCQTTRGKKLKPKPNLTRTSRAAQSKPQTTEDPITHRQPEGKPSSPTSRSTSSDTPGAEREVQPTSHSAPPGRPSEIKNIGARTLLVPPLESCSSHKPAEELTSTEGQKTDVGTAKVSSSGGSEKNEPQRRQRFTKVKPNLGSYTRNKATKLQLSDCSKPSELCQISSKTSDQLCVNPQPAQTDSVHLTSTHCSSQAELKSLTKLRPAESEMAVDSPNDKGTKSDGVVMATPSEAESVSALTGSVVEKRSSEKATVEGESVGDLVTQWDYKEHMSVRVTETNALPVDDPTAVLDVESSGDGSDESKLKSADTESTSDPKERTQQQSQDAVQQTSETPQPNRAAAQR